jgi:hypothetical protein
MQVGSINRDFSASASFQYGACRKVKKILVTTGKYHSQRTKAIQEYGAVGISAAVVRGNEKQRIEGGRVTEEEVLNG